MSSPEEVPEFDAIDEVVDEVRSRLPEITVDGLPIVGRVLRLAREFEARREEQLEPFGLTVGDFDMLATMRRRAADRPVNIRELQRSLMLSSGGTTKRLDRLEARGSIRRLPDPTDRRGVLIELTAAGRSLIDEAVPVIMRFETDLVHAAIGSADDRATVEQALRQLLIGQEALHSDRAN